MRILLGLSFFLIVGSIAIYYLRKEKDLFSPMVMFCLLAIVRHVPGITYIPENLFILIDDHRALLVFCYELLAIFCTLFGYFLYTHTKSRIKYKVSYTYIFKPKWMIVAFYIIGFIFGALYIQSAGGYALISEGIRGVDAGNGRSYIRAVMFLMVVAMALYIHYRRIKKARILTFTLLLMYLGYASFFFILTSRSPVMEALMILMMVYHYDVKRFNIMTFFTA